MEFADYSYEFVKIFAIANRDYRFKSLFLYPNTTSRNYGFFEIGIIQKAFDNYFNKITLSPTIIISEDITNEQRDDLEEILRTFQYIFSSVNTPGVCYDDTSFAEEKQEKLFGLCQWFYRLINWRGDVENPTITHAIRNEFISAIRIKGKEKAKWNSMFYSYYCHGIKRGNINDKLQEKFHMDSQNVARNYSNSMPSQLLMELR